MRQVPTGWLKEMPTEFREPNTAVFGFVVIALLLFVAYLFTSKDENLKP
jgi:hypothetical protein